MNNFKGGGFRQGGGSSDGRPKFGGNDRFGGNKFGGGRNGGDRSGRPAQLFPAVCSECRKNCEVPFRPTGDKPVYCHDCFIKQRQVPGRNSNGADGPRPDFRRDALPQRENQFEPARPQNNGGIDALKRQLDSLESKVNRILELVSQKPEPPRVAPMAKEALQATKTAKPKNPAGKAVTKGKK